MLRRILIIMPLALVLCLQVGSHQWNPSIRWSGWFVGVDRGAVYIKDDGGKISGFRITPSSDLALEESIGNKVKHRLPVRRLYAWRWPVYVVQLWPLTALAAALVVWRKPWRRRKHEVRGFEVTGSGSA